MKALIAVAALFASGTAIAQERDARGIPVVSEDPNVPAGVNQSVTIPQGAQVTLANPSQFFQTRPATAAYPPCERGQTDRCTQTYEGRRTATRSRRRR
jgi:hypothetical protein